MAVCILRRPTYAKRALDDKHLATLQLNQTDDLKKLKRKTFLFFLNSNKANSKDTWTITRKTKHGLSPVAAGTS